MSTKCIATFSGGLLSMVGVFLIYAGIDGALHEGWPIIFVVAGVMLVAAQITMVIHDIWWDWTHG